MDWIESIGGGAVGGGLVGGAIVSTFVWLAKGWFSHFLDKRLEVHRTQLAEDAEKFRLACSQTLFEHQTRFGKAHERRMKAIESICLALRQAHVCFSSLVKVLDSSEAPPMDEKESLAKGAFKRLHESFTRHRVYLERDICDEIDGLLRELREAYGLWDEQLHGDPGRQTTDSRYPLGEAKSIVQTKVPPIIAKLEHRFRVILGIERGEHN